jgi:hypothetical protein
LQQNAKVYRPLQQLASPAAPLQQRSAVYAPLQHDGFEVVGVGRVQTPEQEPAHTMLGSV